MCDRPLPLTPMPTSGTCSVDCLNTHQSESLVRFVAEFEQNDIDLGVKGESGILQSMQTKAAFLSDPTQRKSVSLYTQALFLAQSD